MYIFALQLWVLLFYNKQYSEKKDLDITFNYIQQSTPEDTAKMLASVVDYVILLYIAENKK